MINQFYYIGIFMLLLSMAGKSQSSKIIEAESDTSKNIRTTNLYLTPNPTEGVLKIVRDGFIVTNKVPVEIYNTKDELVKTGLTHHGTILTDGLPPGKYCLKIESIGFEEIFEKL